MVCINLLRVMFTLTRNIDLLNRKKTPKPSDVWPSLFPCFADRSSAPSTFWRLFYRFPFRTSQFLLIHFLMQFFLIFLPAPFHWSNGKCSKAAFANGRCVQKEHVYGGYTDAVYTMPIVDCQRNIPVWEECSKKFTTHLFCTLSIKGTEVINDHFQTSRSPTSSA